MSTRAVPPKKKKRISKSLRAGLTFPVTRCYRQFRHRLPKFRISEKGTIYCAAVLEYLTAEVLELAGAAAKQLNKRRLTPRAIFLGISTDSELYEMNKHVTIPEAGVVPRLPHESLLQKRPAQHRPAAGASKSHPQPLVIYTKPAGNKKVSGTRAKTAKTHACLYAVLSEKLLLTGQRLTVVQADIASIAVDAIVHPTSSNYALVGEVGTALAKIGGTVFAQELKNMEKDHGPIPEEGATISRGHGFGAPWVVHVNGPNWSSNDTPKSVEALENSVKNCLTAADEKKFKSIAVPSIGSGKGGFPKQLAAQTILRAIATYFKDNTTTNLNQLFFVLYDQQSIGVYISELGKLEA